MVKADTESNGETTTRVKMYEWTAVKSFSDKYF